MQQQQQQQQHKERPRRQRCGGFSVIDVTVGLFFVVWLALIAYCAWSTHSHATSLHSGSTTGTGHALPGLQLPAQQGRRRVPDNTGGTTSTSDVPLSVNEIIDYLSKWISDLHDHLAEHKKDKAEGLWAAFHNLTLHTLYEWDQQYLQRMPPRRHDGSIFLSLASYRDENCLNTLTQAFNKARYADKLFVGLIQQNCYQDCRTGIMEDGKSRPQPNPDPDCHADFCQSEIGKPHCNAGRIRALHIQEPESLGPYMARYFASKLWNGEEWFMQVDAHMTFAQDWDHISLEGLKRAPSDKPVLSHYPPAHTKDLKDFETKPSSRICGPIFTSEIIRLEGSLVYDKVKVPTPRFSPFAGAGYFVAHSSFLKEVPFDPFLPWIFMGEEIIMSSRLWTSGYDMFSPSQAVVGHIYFRRHQPKFWESVHRAFTPGVHNPLEELVLERIKCQLGFPESSRDMIPKSLLAAVNRYSMGTVRPLKDYMNMIGMNATTKEVTPMTWCEQGQPPPGFEEYAPLYDEARNTNNNDH